MVKQVCLWALESKPYQFPGLKIKAMIFFSAFECKARKYLRLFLNHVIGSNSYEYY